ncbi:MAG: non-canonical purine NTP pyrophosphatase [Burkholderiales bacterium]|nr:non-canonical purine NTP pyrophosphatase [Burkholderiales bacterium]
MSRKKIYFVSKNRFKQAEACQILEPLGISVEANYTEIEELQTINTDLLIRDKAARAFKKIGRPLFVEHTGLYLDLLNGFPGGLTQIFWDSLEKNRFSELFAHDTYVATAKTTIGYVDGQRVHVFQGEIAGRIVSPPRVDHGFQWDCVFVPEGGEKAFSEMGDAKNEISMRRRALEGLRCYLEGCT